MPDQKRSSKLALDFSACLKVLARWKMITQDTIEATTSNSMTICTRKLASAIKLQIESCSCTFVNSPAQIRWIFLLCLEPDTYRTAFQPWRSAVSLSTLAFRLVGTNCRNQVCR